MKAHLEDFDQDSSLTHSFLLYSRDHLSQYTNLQRLQGGLDGSRIREGDRLEIGRWIGRDGSVGVLVTLSLSWMAMESILLLAPVKP